MFNSQWSPYYTLKIDRYPGGDDSSDSEDFENLDTDIVITPTHTDIQVMPFSDAQYLYYFPSQFLYATHVLVVVRVLQ